MNTTNVIRDPNGSPPVELPAEVQAILDRLPDPETRLSWREHYLRLRAQGR